MAKISVGPGHCPPDFGACYWNLKEHIEATKVWSYLQNLLRESGHQVLDVFGPLKAKVKEINRWDPDLAVEIHFNSPARLRRNGAHGTETLHYPTSREGIKLALAVQRNLLRTCGLRDRGIKARADLYYLRETHCSAVITEPLFLSSQKDIEILLGRRHVDIAIGIFDGIQEYLEGP